MNPQFNQSINMQQNYPPQMIHGGPMNGYPNQIYMQPPMNRTQHQINEKDIFIKNLDLDVSEEEIREWGEEYGSVIDVKFFPKIGWKNAIVSMTDTSRPAEFIEKYNGTIPEGKTRRIGMSFMRPKASLGLSVVVRIVGLPEEYTPEDMKTYITDNGLDHILDTSYPYPITVKPDSRPAASRTNGSHSQAYIHCKTDEKSRVLVKYIADHPFTYKETAYELRADPLPKRTPRPMNNPMQLQMQRMYPYPMNFSNQMRFSQNYPQMNFAYNANQPIFSPAFSHGPMPGQVPMPINQQNIPQQQFKRNNINETNNNERQEF